MAAMPTREAEKTDGIATDFQQPTSNIHSEKAEQEQRHASNEAQKEQVQQQDSHGDDSEDPAAKKAKGPAGGFDSTPIPFRPPGYTIKITMHRAENLPMADFNAFSSDPYCLAQIITDTPRRHKEEPYLRWRSSTVRKNIEPEWNEEWIVANVPETGFKLKVRIYDEDAADSDDLLGKIHLTVPSLSESWPGIKNESYKLIAHDGSKRAYLLQAAATCFRKDKRFRGYLFLSVEMLGPTKEDGQNGRLYTVGPSRWFRHYSPMLGRLLNVKEPDREDAPPSSANGKPQKKVDTFNFQANQLQLPGPVPAELYHRFVEFKPWVGRMFTSKGFSGVLMGAALHHQHTRVYNFGRSTECGVLPEASGEEITKKFLELVHYDQGGRIFTYVLTLDALWRFTETGKEFGIDMLSKHTMHSDVSIYIAFSGEFFVRRAKQSRRSPDAEAGQKSHPASPGELAEDDDRRPQLLSNPSKRSAASQEALRHPSNYELVIDNDSGTYRPNAAMLPVLKSYLASQLPGLRILTLDCNADAERQQRLKKEQRERKKAEGNRIIYTQRSRSSSLSSSDMEELDAVQAGLLDEEAVQREHGVFSQAAKDAKLKNRARMQKIKKDYVIPGHGKHEGGSVPEDAQAEGAGAA